MFSTVLEYVNITAVLCAGCFAAGVILSQKIKDYLTGVPTELRSALTSLESKTKGDISAATADVVAKIAPGHAKKAEPPPAAPAA